MQRFRYFTTLAFNRDITVDGARHYLKQLHARLEAMPEFWEKLVPSGDVDTQKISRLGILPKYNTKQLTPDSFIVSSEFSSLPSHHGSLAGISAPDEAQIGDVTGSGFGRAAPRAGAAPP